METGDMKLSESSSLTTEFAGLAKVDAYLEAAEEYLKDIESDVNGEESYKGLGSDDMLVFVQAYIEHIQSLRKLYDKAVEDGKSIVDTFDEMDNSMAAELTDK